jgi:hypothetical protein
VRAPAASKPLNIRDLLAKSKLAGKEIPQLADEQDFWFDLLRGKLEPALFGAITGIVERDTRLTVMTRSAEWAARLRFALAELWPQLREARATLSACAVRVQPAAAESRRART